MHNILVVLNRLDGKPLILFQRPRTALSLTSSQSPAWRALMRNDFDCKRLHNNNAVHKRSHDKPKRFILIVSNCNRVTSVSPPQYKTKQKMHLGVSLLVQIYVQNFDDDSLSLRHRHRQYLTDYDGNADEHYSYQCYKSSTRLCGTATCDRCSFLPLRQVVTLHTIYK